MRTESMMRRPPSTFPAAAAAVAILLAVACTRSAAADVVARVGGTEVTTEELRAYLGTLAPREQEGLARDPALLSQVVRSYLARRAVLGEARARKWEDQPSVKARLDQARDEALTELYLQSVSRPPDGYPTDADVKAAYEGNREVFQLPKQFRVAQIFIAAARAGGQEAEAKARPRLDEVVRMLKAKGADFAAIARAHSEEKGAAERGGEIGWLAEAQMVPGIRSAVVDLAQNAVSDPIRLDDGWHLVKVLETRPASTRPLAEVREAIVAQLRAERTQALRQAHLAKLLDRNPPVLNELALSKVLPGKR